MNMSADTLDVKYLERLRAALIQLENFHANRNAPTPDDLGALSTAMGVLYCRIEDLERRLCSIAL